MSKLSWRLRGSIHCRTDWLLEGEMAVRLLMTREVREDFVLLSKRTGKAPLRFPLLCIRSIYWLACAVSLKFRRINLLSEINVYVNLGFRGHWLVNWKSDFNFVVISVLLYPTISRLPSYLVIRIQPNSSLNFISALALQIAASSCPYLE